MGVVHLATFMDDDENADPRAPAPGPGDLVHAPNGVGNGSLDCVQVDVVDRDVDGVQIVLDGVVPGAR